MQVISYVSECSIPDAMRPEEIGKIVSSAQTRNASLGISGVLFIENNCFFQTIEGPHDTLSNLFEKIQRDERHHSIIKLVDEPIQERSFNGWALESFSADNPELVNPGVLSQLKSLYVDNIGMDVAGLIRFVRYMIDELDTYKLKTELE